MAAAASGANVAPAFVGGSAAGASQRVVTTTPPRLVAGHGVTLEPAAPASRFPSALSAVCAAAAVAACKTATSTRKWAHVRQRGHHVWGKSRVVRAAGTEIDLSPEISFRPEKKIVKELAKYEDPDDPKRPMALPRPRRGKWAPPLPEPKDAPEALVVGLGRQLRESEAQGPRARLGAAAVEALQNKFGVSTHYDAEIRGYVGNCRASLDKSGYAGVQKINMLQPVVERDNDVASAVYKAMQEPGMENAMILLVLSDWRLPFGQLRLRAGYDEDDDRVRLAYNALNPGNRVNCLHIGAGLAAASDELLPAEVGALPRVLANAAAAIEVWLSEADLGLVMRFVNRPEVYEMPPGWPYQDAALPPGQAPKAELDGSDAAALPSSASAPAAATDVDSEDAEPLDAIHNAGALLAPAPADESAYEGFTLFDLNREHQTEQPRLNLAPMSPAAALEALQERPPGSEALRIADRRHASLAALQGDLSRMMTSHKPGMHLRLDNDEATIKALLSYHPDGDRLLEDLVAVKVDCSPVDDDMRCLWVIKFDGYEEDVSLKECLRGLRQWVELHPEGNGPDGAQRRLGVGRWTRGLRESTFDRARAQEALSIAANGEKRKWSPKPKW